MTQTTLDQKNNGYYLWLYFIAFLRKPKARVLPCWWACLYNIHSHHAYPLASGNQSRPVERGLNPNIQIRLYSTIPNPLLYSSSIHHHGKYPSALGPIPISPALTYVLVLSFTVKSFPLHRDRSTHPRL